ncbi:MAG: substrate-binding domain-containing protein [Anaerolineales bacterium]|nr:substrate-binding domain-containing protein [Anaerolineales bacterium]
MDAHSAGRTRAGAGSRKDRSQRPVFGFLLASLHTGASRALWPGLIDAADRNNVNLICFPGGRLRGQVSFETQRNVIYDLAGKEYLDGLVTWASSLGGVLGPSEINLFHQRYQTLPMISLAQFMEGTPTVSVDSYHGMRALLEHLIQDHGYTRLAFIRGPEEHYYAQERYRAYLDTLQAHNLPLLPELVTRPLRWEAGTEAIRILLDERRLRPGLDFQALVAVSDLLAVWGLKTLQERGFKIPGDVAVTGFNNSIEERLATPPLTTVDLPFYDQGAKALELLLALWKGEAVPALLTLPSRLIIRQSCGCPSAAVDLAARMVLDSGLAGDGPLDQLPARLQAARSDCLVEMAADSQISAERIGAWIAPVFDAFLADLQHPSGGAFLPTLEDILDRAMRENSDVNLWHGAISALRRLTLPGIPEAGQGHFESLFAQARVVISEAVQRAHAYWQWQAERQAENLRRTAEALLTTFDIPLLTDVLVERLPRLGIPSASLVLYENPTESLEYARLVMAYSEQGRVTLEPAGQRFRARQLLPAQCFREDRQYCLVVEPLFFQDRSIGYVVFEIGPHEGDVYELVRSNLSSALQGAHLFQEIQQARITAEKADRIKTRLLANVSHELRTPLNIILGYTQNALRDPSPYPAGIPEPLGSDLQHIQQNAAHQLRVINDLLDLSRAEIDELDLALDLIDPRPLLEEAFFSLADQSASQAVEWKLEFPERLPVIRADAVRLRQIVLNLLSNARKFTQHGKITFGAEVAPPRLHLWVSDTGVGIPSDQQEHIFEPFITVQDDRRIPGGIGLGLSITRHLIALHGGSLTLESQTGKGSTFHVHLPLPALDKESIGPPQTQPVLLVISSSEPAAAIRDLCLNQNLEARLLRAGDNLESILADTRPVALAWDLATAQPEDWGLIRRLRHYPRLAQTPFILFGQSRAPEPGIPDSGMGLTGFLVKSPDGQNLLDMIEALCPVQTSGSILVVDDDPQARRDHIAIVEQGLPNQPITSAENGEAALAAMQAEVPALVLLDIVMPGLDGMDVLDRMRQEARLRQVPVIFLSNKPLSQEDVQRLESHAHVTYQSKGLFSESETASAIFRALLGTEELPPQTSALVKRALAFLHANYAHAIVRWEIASAIGVSEDYLSRVFSRELGLTPWDYLNRYRVLQARTLLLNTNQNIGNIAREVGFKDQAYFSRVFRKITGESPQSFRDRDGQA